MMKFPLDAQALTPSLLTEALRPLHPDIRIDSFEVLESSVHGDGSTSTADRLKLRLHFEAGRDGEVPERILLKTMLVQPHVPVTMYENEVLFYRYIRPGLDIETPKVYATAYDRDTGQFGILMEDLSVRGVRFLQATQSLTLQQMKTGLDAMAELHARHWDNPTLSTLWKWLPTAARGGMADVFRTEGWYQHVLTCVAENPDKQAAIQRLGKSLDTIWAELWKVIDHGALSTGPFTLLHGDLHMANIYLAPDERIGLIDWQLASRGSWVQDFTYLMITALDTDTRRRHEHELLRYYLNGLARRGVTDVPAIDDALLRYRQSAIWGFAVGWLGAPTENYGPEVMRANIDRLAQSLLDLKTFDAIAT